MTGPLPRLFLRALSVLVVLAPLVVVPATSASAAVSITWARKASGLAQPVQVATARDGSGRVFVVEKGGRIRIWKNGRLQATPYLDIRSRVRDAGEGGLLSVAFHPRWKTRPSFWVAYTTNAGYLRVARFTASRYTANTVSAGTEKTIMQIPHPTAYTNHWGGQVAFGPDGFLYVSTGDGGGSGDPGNRAQNLRSLAGKILRIDVVDAPSKCGKAFCIPRTNPFVRSSTARHSIWAYGLRNPWRFSFDAGNGNLWIGDVGQSRQEEVDRLPAGVGGRNFGWSCREGRLVYNSSRCRAGATYTGPVYVYGRSVGSSITGGYVYRGAKYRSLLRGRYVFGDFGSGRIFYTTSSGLRRAGSLPRVTGFGVGGSNELWAVTIDGGLYAMRARAT